MTLSNAWRDSSEVAVKLSSITAPPILRRIGHGHGPSFSQAVLAEGLRSGQLCENELGNWLAQLQARMTQLPDVSSVADQQQVQQLVRRASQLPVPLLSDQPEARVWWEELFQLFPVDQRQRELTLERARAYAAGLLRRQQRPGAAAQHQEPNQGPNRLDQALQKLEQLAQQHGETQQQIQQRIQQLEQLRASRPSRASRTRKAASSAPASEAADRLLRLALRSGWDWLPSLRRVLAESNIYSLRDNGLRRRLECCLPAHGSRHAQL